MANTEWPTDSFDTWRGTAASDQDRETLRQQCLLAYDRSAVARALDPVAAAIADAETAAAVAAATAAADAIPLAN